LEQSQSAISHTLTELYRHPQRYYMSAKLSSKLAIISSASIVLSMAMAFLNVSPSNASPRYRYKSAPQTQLNQNRFSKNQSPQNATPQNATPQYQVAQVFRSSLSLPIGQAIATKINRQDTLYIAKGETVNATLLVAQDIAANNGTVLIPAGAAIEGQFVPADGGSKFVAQKFTSRGATVKLQAESALINDVKDPRETNAGAILTDAGIGGAAGAVLGGVLRGNVQIIDILGGAAASVLVGNVTAPQVTVIEPSTVINIVTKQTITFAVRDDY
jgi:hypothetical protein